MKDMKLTQPQSSPPGLAGCSSGGAPTRRTRSWPVRLAAAAVVGVAVVAGIAPQTSAQAMKPGGDGATIQNPTSDKPKWLPDVGIDQKLGAQVPADVTFRDSFGQPVKFADLYAKGRPILFTLVYYGCPRTCTAALNEMTKAMRTMSLNPGSDFDVVVVSFDPREGPDLAAKKKLEYQSLYRRPGTEAGWNFMTGDEANIKALASAVGFRYAWDEKHDQYIHAAGLMVLTPDGKISKYLYGVEYTGLQLKLALMDAAGKKIGTVSDQVLRYCFEYDPHSGKYTIAVMTIVRTACVLTVVGLVGFMLVNFRRDRSASPAATAAGTGPTPGGPPDGPPAGDGLVAGDGLAPSGGNDGKDNG
jgi:protein SCO1/2